MKLDGFSGFRRYWLALEKTTAQVRDINRRCVLAIYEFQEGDGLILDNANQRVDWRGSLIPIGSHEILERRSVEVRTALARRLDRSQPSEIPAVTT